MFLSVNPMVFCEWTVNVDFSGTALYACVLTRPRNMVGAHRMSGAAAMAQIDPYHGFVSQSSASASDAGGGGGGGGGGGPPLLTPQTTEQS